MGLGKLNSSPTLLKRALSVETGQVRYGLSGPGLIFTRLLFGFSVSYALDNFPQYPLVYLPRRALTAQRNSQTRNRVTFHFIEPKPFLGVVDEIRERRLIFPSVIDYVKYLGVTLCLMNPERPTQGPITQISSLPVASGTTSQAFGTSTSQRGRSSRS